MQFLKSIGIKLGIGAALGASTLMIVAPAQAQDRYYDGRGNDAAIAIGAGVIGLALGAALADRSDRYYYDRSYYGSRRYVSVRDRPGRYYYYANNPNRYYQDRYYDRYYAPYYRDRNTRNNSWNNRNWNRGNDRRYDRQYSRRDDRRWDRRDGRYDNRRNRDWGRR